MKQITTINVLDCRHEFLANGKIWLHAVDEMEIVAKCSLEIIADEWMWINDLFVTEDRRRTGVADFLVDYAERFALSHANLIGTAAAVNRDNVPSRKLFASRGYLHSYTYPENRTLLLSKSFEGREAT